MKVESIQAARAAYDIEAQCILEMKDYFDEVAFSRAVHLLAQAPRIGAAGWNVAQTEAYVEKRLAALRTIPPKGRSTYIIKDVRLFLNSVDRGLRLMHAAGIPARWNREDTDGEIQLTISIPKRREARERVGTVTEL